MIRFLKQRMQNFALTAGLVALVVIFSYTESQATVPQLINLQGRLTDTSGAPRVGAFDITLSLYDFPTGGTAFWSETHSAVPVADGLFALLLGSINPLSNGTGPAGDEIWLGIAVGADPEMSPRTRFAATPFSFEADRAISADTAGFARDVQDFSITESKLSFGSVTSDKLADNSVTSTKIAEGAVGPNQLLDNSVDGSKIVDGSVSTLDIEDASVTGPKIADGAIGATKLATGSVNSAAIADKSILFSDISQNGASINFIMKFNGTDWIPRPDVGNVYSAGSGLSLSALTFSIAPGGVNSSHIQDGTLKSADIAANAIGSAHIQSGAVTTSEIADNTITGADIQNGSIGSVDIATGAVISTKIGNGSVGSTQIATSAITSAKLADDAVTTSKIAFGAVGASELAANSVGNSEIANNAVLSGEIADGQVLTADIGLGAVTNAKLSPNSVTTNNIVNGTILAADLATNSVNSAEIAAGAVGSSEIAAGAVGASELADNAVTTTKVLDEPGVAQSIALRNPGAQIVRKEIITSAVINCPASGYVLAMASCFLVSHHTKGSSKGWIHLGIVDTATFAAWPPSFPNQQFDLPPNAATGTYSHIISTQRIFQVNSGANTFYFMGEPVISFDSTSSVADVRLSLMYFPTAYGVVQE